MWSSLIAATGGRLSGVVSALLPGFVPAAVAPARHERIKSCVGALLGLFLTEWLCRQALGAFNPWFIAPMGASAVLLFAVPSSPLAQPWSIIGGNLVSAVVGVACARWIPDPGLAAAVAVSLAIAAMFALRCVHPPGGAVAVTAVFGGAAVTKLGFAFAVFPVAVNSMLLLVVALIFNNAMRRRYPHRPHEQGNIHRTADPMPADRIGFNRADLDAVLAARGEFLDIDPEDLEDILVAAELRAYRRRFGEVRVADIMSRDVVTIDADSRVGEAWKLLTTHRLQSLPVISRKHGQLVGIVTLADLVSTQRGGAGLLRDGIVRDAMMTRVPVAQPEQPMVELARSLLEQGLHHMPVVDERHRLIGMVTQSDLVGALIRSRGEGKG